MMRSVVLAVLMLGTAAPVSAEAYMFDADTTDAGHYSFKLDAASAPSLNLPGLSFVWGNHNFYNAVYGGGFDLYRGDQLYTGDEAAPTFRFGTFAIFGDDALNERRGTVTISAAASDVPEPAVWAMMVGGFAAVGGALRTRRAHRGGMTLEA